MLVSTVGVLITTTAIANAKGSCTKSGGTVAVPVIDGVTTKLGSVGSPPGGKTYSKVICTVTNSDGKPWNGSVIGLQQPWKTGNAKTNITLSKPTGNWFVCTLPFGNINYVLTEADAGGWGWINSVFLSGTPGLCSSDGSVVPANSPDTKNYRTGVQVKTADGNSDTIDSGSVKPGSDCVKTKTYRVPSAKGTAPQPAFNNKVVAGQSYKLSVCLNESGIPVNDIPGTDHVTKVDTLISKQSFFACKTISGGDEYLLTQGDTAHKWGYVSASKITNAKTTERDVDVSNVDPC